MDRLPEQAGSLARDTPNCELRPYVLSRAYHEQAARSVKARRHVASLAHLAAGRHCPSTTAHLRRELSDGIGRFIRPLSVEQLAGRVRVAGMARGFIDQVEEHPAEIAPVSAKARLTALRARSRPGRGPLRGIS
jgi:hypothetical protein